MNQLSQFSVTWRRVAAESHLYENEFVEEDATAHIGYRDARHYYERAHHYPVVNIFCSLRSNCSFRIA